jgi:hypothetical protein
MKKVSLFVLLLTAALLLISCELTGTAPSKGTLHVVAIGDNFTTRPEGINPLFSCENDATAVCQVFEYWGKMAGMKTDIHNCNGLYLSGFEAELAKVITSASDDDLTVIFISTHGGNVYEDPALYSDYNNLGAFFVLEQKDGNVITVQPYIAQSSLQEVANSIRGKVLVIADFCNSGALVPQNYFTYNSANFTGSSPLSLFFDSTPATDSNRVFYLTACTYYELARAGATLSMFTNHLLSSMGMTSFNPTTGKAIVSSDAPVFRNNRIILSDIYTYIFERTATIQVPQMNTGANDLVLFSL